MADELVDAVEAPVETSTRASVEMAYAKAFAPESDEGYPDAEEAPSVDRARGPDGKFVAKDAVEAPTEPVEAAPEVDAPVVAPEAPVASVDAPSRFSADAKAAWATTPPAVQAEINRAFSEMEKGINDYRAKYEPIRAIAEQAEAQGQSLADVIGNYRGIEDTLRQNPLQGLDLICKNMGLTLRDVAAHVMGQPAPERDAQVSQLSQQLHQMQGELARYQAAERRQHEEQQARTLETVSGFASSQPRFAELQHQIAWALKTEAVARTGDPAKDLQNAYDFAARLIPAAANPAQVAIPATAVAPTPPQVQPKKAGISIDGAPGSNPTVRPASKSTREALSRAAASVGLA
jgi:DNA-binding transcriptional MerR regulator